MAMMAIRGIYEKHNVQSLNHGIGFNTAAIELILPTYGESLGLKGKICRNWTLNPHPTLIPAIESGWVESVHCFGTELGMENYIAARPDVFFTGRDGSCVPTGCSANSPGNTRWICSSAPPCKSMATAILRP
jgi:malonate decarboxylase alpha subunit